VTTLVIGLQGVIIFQFKEKIMSITTTSSLPAPVQQSFSYKLLSVPVPNMIH